VTEVVHLAGMGDLPLVGQDGPFARDDDPVGFTAGSLRLEQLAHPVDINRLFRNENKVGSGRNPRKTGDPPGVSPHRLDDHHATVRFGSRPQSIDGLHHDIDRGVEPECVIGATQIVVNRFGDTHGRKVFLFVQTTGNSQGIVAADCDQSVQLQPLERLQKLGDVRRIFVRIRSGRSEDRPPLVHNFVGLRRIEGDCVSLNRAAPSFEQADAFSSGIVNRSHDPSDDRIQRGAIAPSGQHRNFHNGSSFLISLQLLADEF